MDWKVEKTKSQFLGKEALFLTGPKPDAIRLGRVWGGLSWPGVKGGYLVLMAQPDNKEGRPLYLVAEKEKELTRDLVKAAADIQDAYHVKTWYHIGGDPARPFMTEAYRAMDGIADEKRPSVLDAPEYPPEYALSLLKQAMVAEHLKLHPDLSRMMDELTQITQAQEPLAKLETLPAVRALLLLLGAVERSPWPPRDYSRLLEGGLAKTYGHR
jgi:hypothetical protein